MTVDRRAVGGLRVLGRYIRSTDVEPQLCVCVCVCAIRRQINSGIRRHRSVQSYITCRPSQRWNQYHDCLLLLDYGRFTVHFASLFVFTRSTVYCAHSNCHWTFYVCTLTDTRRRAHRAMRSVSICHILYIDIYFTLLTLHGRI